MKITGFENDVAILKELGTRIKRQRIASNLSQVQLAMKCGLSESSIKRIESGNDFRILHLIKIMGALDIAENLDLLIPVESTDYKAIFEEQPSRKRVRTKKASEPPKWSWGEDKE